MISGMQNGLHYESNINLIVAWNKGRIISEIYVSSCESLFEIKCFPALFMTGKLSLVDKE
jgi:hypothetical protein